VKSIIISRLKSQKIYSENFLTVQIPLASAKGNKLGFNSQYFTSNVESINTTQETAAPDLSFERFHPQTKCSNYFEQHVNKHQRTKYLSFDYLHTQGLSLCT